MALPRFHRLPAERREQVLSAARHHLATVGLVDASYNQIIAAAGISKTSAYLYFDGKNDLIAEVMRDILARVAEVLGTWAHTTSKTEFWQQLRVSSSALQRHLLANPDDLAVLATAAAENDDPAASAWLCSVVDNGIEIGLIRRDIDREIILAATRGVMRALDGWALARMLEDPEGEHVIPWQLLENMWAPQPSEKPSEKPNEK